MNLSALMIFHITAGAFGLIAGWTALLVRKGAWLHRTAGNVFFVSMILMSAAGVALAVLKPAAPTFNTIVGVLTIYLVSTSWATVLRKEGKTGGFEVAAFLVVLAVAAYGLILGLGAKSATAIGLFFFFAGAAALAALLDISVIVRRGVSGAQRIARHLWRMGSALSLGTLAFFVGQGAKVFPEAVRETYVNVVPLIVVLALTVFWLVRVLWTNWYQRQRTQTAPAQ